jgi:hypothetical protein
VSTESLAVDELTPSKLIDTVDEFGCRWNGMLAVDEMAVDDLTPPCIHIDNCNCTVYRASSFCYSCNLWP